jgi:DNA-binding transcriptional MerR regulator
VPPVSPANARPHGHFLAAEAGELAGVSGTTIGQWARRGLIRSSVSDEEPRVYSVEDVAEAAIVHALLDRGVRHADVHRLIARLGPYGEWPLSQAALATTDDNGSPLVVLREDEGDWVLTARGWQRPAAPLKLREVRLRLSRRAA